MDVVEVCRLLCSCDVHLMSEWFTTSSPFQLNGAYRNKSKCVQVSKVSKYVSVHLTFISGRVKEENSQLAITQGGESSTQDSRHIAFKWHHWLCLLNSQHAPFNMLHCDPE